MVTYYIQKHLLQANVRVTIKNLKGKPEYLLVGRWGVRGDSLSIYDLEGRALASVKPKNFAFRSQFELFENHQKVGEMGRVFPIPKDIYFIKGVKWLVLGDSLAASYHVYQLAKKVMTVTTIGNVYKIEIEEEEKVPLCLCLAAVLDYWSNSHGLRRNWLERKNYAPNLTYIVLKESLKDGRS
ncbi:LURP-one-related/scramblase family protein [Vagococcus sp.]|uniref:LURP-one-related/scramblase family protein n=1 Tax=Vagococcus sp. TaxID=1933889 RepID=UPI003F95A4D1